jgi:DNA polymerase I-like protein with 3'-5' exonuclease and polymerase domains/uracil-DNA glycosylase
LSHPECDRCPRAEISTSVGVAGREVQRGSKGKVLIVFDQPDTREVEIAEHFGYGRYHELVIKMAQVHMPDFSIYVTGAVRCWGGRKNNGKPKDPHAPAVKGCRKWLVEDVTALKPDLIIPVGKYAIATVLKLPFKDASPNQMAATDFDTEWGCKCVPVQTPGWALFDPDSNGAVWDRVWKDVAEFAAHGQPTYKKYPWRSIDTPNTIRQFYEDELLPMCKLPGTRVAYDYESTDHVIQDPTNKLIMVSYSWDGESAAVVPLQTKEQHDLHRKFLATPCRKIVHSAQFEIGMAQAKLGAEPDGPVTDIKLLAYLDNENRRMALDYLVAEHLPDMYGFKRASEREARKNGWKNLPYAVLANRNAYDAIATFKLAKILSERLDSAQAQLYTQVIEKALFTIARMRNTGWLVNRQMVEAKKKICLDHAAALREEIDTHPDVVAWCEAVGVKELKLTSRSDHLPRLLMSLGVRPLDWRGKLITQDNNPELIVTGAKYLKPLTSVHPIIEPLLEMFKYLDLATKFCNPILRWSEADGYIHPGYNLGGQIDKTDASGTVTLRLSSKDPNVMNYPPFITPVFRSRHKNGRIGQRDYSQVELRIMGYAAGDEIFNAAFKRGEDPHQATADAAGCSRQEGKTLNFMVAYGGGIQRIMQELGCTEDHARMLLNRFWQAHPKIKAMFARWKLQAVTTGVISGLFGQNLHVPDAMDPNPKVKSHAFLRAGNFPIQNGGAVLTLRAMWRVDFELRARGLKSALIAQLHDSLYIDIYPGEEAEVEELTRSIMEDEPPKIWPWLDVPFTTEWSCKETMGFDGMKFEKDS